LTIQENADPDVLFDLNNFFKKLVPMDNKLYKHTIEGKDDMPAHIRTMLTSNNLSFSVVDGKLEIGLWQGIYIWEHRASIKSRSLQLHAIGDFDLN